MTTNVILPALGMAQETGKIIRWLKTEGAVVTQGDPLVEIETDKATVELEAPASGLLTNITAASDAEIPVGQTIALIVEPGTVPSPSQDTQPAAPASSPPPMSRATSDRSTIPMSPLAARIAAEHHLNVDEIQPVGRRIQKADVISYLQQREQEHREQAGNGAQVSDTIEHSEDKAIVASPYLRAASPKARRLAR